MWTVKTLIRLGECPGWSELSLGAQSFCWFCREAAHLSMKLQKLIHSLHPVLQPEEKVLIHTSNYSCNPNNYFKMLIFEPQNDKTCSCHMRIKKTQMNHLISVFVIQSIWHTHQSLACPTAINTKNPLKCVSGLAVEESKSTPSLELSE